jgi:hypothetical protein
MSKRFLPLFLAPLLLAGCTTSFTDLSAHHQVRNANNLYPLEVAFDNNQQSLRWETIKPQIMSGGEFYPMRPTPLMTNRWEGVIPVPAGASSVHYRYKFEFQYNAIGKPKSDSVLSPDYTLRVTDK